jgi:hypothetical protein
VQDDVLGVDAGAEEAAHLDTTNFETGHRETLGGEHVAHLRRSNAHGDGAERAVRRRVRVAARNGDAGLREPELGTDDVHDALATGLDVEKRDAELLAGLLQRLHHSLGQRVLKGALAVVGRNDVVDRRERALRHENAEPEIAEHPERLRARHFVNEMQADEELRLAARQTPHGVQVPDLVE